MLGQGRSFLIYMKTTIEQTKSSLVNTFGYLNLCCRERWRAFISHGPPQERPYEEKTNENRRHVEVHKFAVYTKRDDIIEKKDIEFMSLFYYF